MEAILILAGVGVIALAVMLHVTRNMDLLETIVLGPKVFMLVGLGLLILFAILWTGG